MDESRLRTFHSVLQKDLDEKISFRVVEKINELIPGTEGVETYIYYNHLDTFGELKSTLCLFDKSYESPIHKYGTKETLLYAYRKVTPGLIYDHRARTDRGSYRSEKKDSNPIPGDKRKSNILLIKTESWDTNKIEHKEYYTIFVYKYNPNAEHIKIEDMNKQLASLKEQARNEGIYFETEHNKVNS